MYTVPSPLFVADPNTLNHDYDKRTSTTQTQCCSFDYGSGSRISSKFRSHIWIHADSDSGPWFLLTKTLKVIVVFKSMFDQDRIIPYGRPISRQENSLKNF